ncbi:MAG: DNA primase [candidate division FCPU426 bacterium]
MIAPEIIQKVRDATDIVTVVSRSVSLKKAGANMKGLCPFHDERSPSFTVHPGKQIYHCFGCGEGGDVFSYLVKRDKLSFVEAVKQLAGEAGIEIPEEAGEDRAEAAARAAEREALLSLLDLAAEWFCRNLNEGTEAAAAREYAEKRGLSKEILTRFRIGYSPGDGGALERAALKKGFTRAQLLAAGLVVQNERGVYCRFRSRLMFPIEDARGKVVGFGGRLLHPGEPKYLNSPETALFSKGRLLFALPQAREALLKKKRVLLTEGYMDAIACHQAGVLETVAVLGTALTEDHARQLKRYVDTVLLVFDADAAGLRAAQRGCEILLKAGLEPKVVRLGKTKDPDEFLKAQGREAFDKELENAGDAVEFFADAALATAKAKKGPEELGLREKAGVMQELFPLLTKYATAMETEVQLRRTAERLGLDLEAVKKDFEAFRENPPLQAIQAPRGGERRTEEDPGEDGEPLDAQEPAPDPTLQRIEEEILALLVCHRELMESAMAELSPEGEDGLCAPDLRAAGALLWRHPQAALMSLDDDASESFRLGQSLLSRLEMSDGGRFPNPHQHLKDLLKRRKKVKLEEKSRRIQEALARRPDEAEERVLLAQKQGLKDALERLKREPR